MTWPAGESPTELSAADIAAFAGKYAAFGYADQGDQLFALLCDVAVVYARTSGETVDDSLRAASENLESGAPAAGR